MQNPLFCFIRIRHMRLVQHAGCSRHIDQPSGQKSSGTGLCCRHCHMTFLQHMNHGFFQCDFFFCRINIIAEPVFQFLYHRRHQLLCRLLVFGFCSDPEVYFPGLCIRRKSRIGLSIHQICNHGLRPAFTDRADLYHAGIDSFRLQPGKIRCNLSFKHRDALIRRPRNQDCTLAFILGAFLSRHNQPRSRTVLILNHNGSLRNQRLLPVIPGNFPL